MTLRNVTTAIYAALGLSLFLTALYYGMGREIERREVARLYNCAQYGHAMNNWARQNNKPEVCEQ